LVLAAGVAHSETGSWLDEWQQTTSSEHLATTWVH